MCSSDGADDLAGVPERRGPVCVQLVQSLSERARCGAFSLSAQHLRENQTTGAGKDQNAAEKILNMVFLPGFIGPVQPHSRTQFTSDKFR